MTGCALSAIACKYIAGALCMSEKLIHTSKLASRPRIAQASRDMIALMMLPDAFS